MSDNPAAKKLLAHARMIALRYTRDEVLAEDVAAEAVFRCWKYGLARIGLAVKHSFIDIKRASRRQIEGKIASLNELNKNKTAHPDNYFEIISDGERDPLDAMLAKEMLSKLTGSSAYCEMVFEGLTYKKMARQKRVKIGTIRSRLSRERARLLNELER